MDSRTGDVDGVAQAAHFRQSGKQEGTLAASLHAAGLDSAQPVALNRKLRRTLKALERRANRRLLRAAYRELRMLRREEGQLPFKTNAIEQDELFVCGEDGTLVPIPSEFRGSIFRREGEELMTAEEIEHYGPDDQVLLPAGLRCASCGNRTNGAKCRQYHAEASE